MKLFLIIAIVVAILIVKAIVAWFMTNAAIMKGHGREAHTFAVCFWLGIFGCIYVATLPDKIQQSQNQRIIELLEKSDNK